MITVSTGEQYLLALLQNIKNSNAEIRRESVHALGQFDDQRAIIALTEALADESVLVRNAANEVLSKKMKSI